MAGDPRSAATIHGIQRRSRTRVDPDVPSEPTERQRERERERETETETETEAHGKQDCKQTCFSIEKPVARILFPTEPQGKLP